MMVLKMSENNILSERRFMISLFKVSYFRDVFHLFTVKISMAKSHKADFQKTVTHMDERLC